MITDNLRSYGAAEREIMPGVEHRSRKELNDWQKLHRPIQRRELIMKRFKSARQLEYFFSFQYPIASLSNVPSHDIHPAVLQNYEQPPCSV